MTSNRMLDRLNSGKVALGLFVNTPDMVELCAHIGFDWFLVDQMFTAHDWSSAEYLLRVGHAADITPVLRVQSNPWLGFDARIAVDVARAQGIGYQFIEVSHSGIREIESCIEVTRDWHKNALNIHPFSSAEDWTAASADPASKTFVIPQPECREALDTLDQVMALEGVDMVFIAMTDASRTLANSATPDFHHPAVWEYIDHIVQVAHQHGVWVGANTSFAYDLDEIAARVHKLADHGVQMIMTQTASFLFQTAVGKFMREVGEILS